jgi:CheY-like chemotaxis protein
MYSEYLSYAGYSVLQAPNASEGLRSARAVRPDVIITDICMPGMDGWEFARALRGNARTSRSHIIAVTGRAMDPGLEEEARDAGIESILIKPCLPDRLLEEIRKLLAKSTELRAHSTQRVARARALRTKSNGLIEVSRNLQRRRR